MKLILLLPLFLSAYVSPVLGQRVLSEHRAERYRIEVQDKDRVRRFKIEFFPDPVPLRGTIMRVSERYRKVYETTWQAGATEVIRYFGSDAVGTHHLQVETISPDGQLERADRLATQGLCSLAIASGETESLAVTLKLLWLDSSGRLRTKLTLPDGAAKILSQGDIDQY